MKKMIYYILGIIVIIFIVKNIISNTLPKNHLKYKFLYRDDIFSSTKNNTQVGDTIYQLAPVMSGKPYATYYLYLPKKEQYLIRSSVEPIGLRRYDAYAPPHPIEEVNYKILNKQGQIIQSIKTSSNFSIRSGMFFTEEFYINWLESGDTTKQTYAHIHNKDVEMDAKQFGNIFRELYAQADYVEYVNLRTRESGYIDCGIVFNIKHEWHILLNSYQNSHIYAKLIKEDKKAGVDIYNYSIKFDYNDPDYKLENPYPQSEAIIKSTYLETSDTDPYYFNKWANHDGLSLVKYNKQSSTGWQGVAIIYGIPIFVPGTGEGIAYMKYKTDKGNIHFKIPDVTKYDYRPYFNLGVRSFKIPKQYNIKDPLVFIESSQNFAHYLRYGGGVYVLRPFVKTNHKYSSIPSNISEERYNQLPLSLQSALVNVDKTCELSVNTWYAEITYLHNLKYLKITNTLDSLPDEISALRNLEVLDLEACGLQHISPNIRNLKQLKQLNLYGNRLDGFPCEICELKGLTHLNIGANSIHQIPNNISNLTKLTQLDILLLHILDLPETMVDMKDLRIRRAEELKEKLPVKFHFLFED